jgi:hypothetical protein
VGGKGEGKRDKERRKNALRIVQVLSIDIQDGQRGAKKKGANTPPPYCLFSIILFPDSSFLDDQIHQSIISIS